MTDDKTTTLVGQKNILLTVPRQLIDGKRNEPVTRETWLGWFHPCFAKSQNRGFVMHIT